MSGPFKNTGEMVKRIDDSATKGMAGAALMGYAASKMMTSVAVTSLKYHSFFHRLIQILCAGFLIYAFYMFSHDEKAARQFGYWVFFSMCVFASCQYMENSYENYEEKFGGNAFALDHMIITLTSILIMAPFVIAVLWADRHYGTKSFQEMLQNIFGFTGWRMAIMIYFTIVFAGIPIYVFRIWTDRRAREILWHYSDLNPEISHEQIHQTVRESRNCANFKRPVLTIAVIVIVSTIYGVTVNQIHFF